MGLGDDVMASGEALEMFQRTGKPVTIGRSRVKPHKSPMFECLPWITQGGRDTETQLLRSYPGHRPYIDYEKSSRERLVLKPDYRAVRGRIRFTKDEELAALRAVGPGLFIAVEPHVKGTFSGQNKRWPFPRWEELAERLAGLRVVQISPPGAKPLARASRMIQTPDVRHALACLSFADVVVTSEGLFHHAAAAFGIPAVVLWGARTDPRILGYSDQANVTSGTDWCGMRARCEHCEAAMSRITVDEVADRVVMALGVTP